VGQVDRLPLVPTSCGPVLSWKLKALLGICYATIFVRLPPPVLVEASFRERRTYRKPL